MSTRELQIEEELIESGAGISRESLGILEALQAPSVNASRTTFRLDPLPTVMDRQVTPSQLEIQEEVDAETDSQILRFRRPLDQYVDFPGLDQLVAAESVVVHLRNSQLTSLLQYLTFEQISHARCLDLQTSRGTETVSVYDMVRINLLSSYYSNRSSTTTVSPAFAFLRYYLRSLRGPPGEANQQIQQSFLAIQNYGIEDLVRMVGNLLIGNPETVPLSVGSTDHVDTTFQNSQIDELQVIYPQALVILSMVNIYMEGRGRNLAPILECVSYDAWIASYFEAITTSSSGNILEITVAIQPLSSFPVRVSTPAPLTQGITSSLSRPVVSQAEMPLPLLSFTSAEVPRTTSTSLLSQATRISPASIRDTSAFMDRVQARITTESQDARANQRLCDIEQGLSRLQDDLSAFRNETHTAITALRADMSNLIALFSSNQLHTQAAYSRTILQQGTPSASNPPIADILPTLNTAPSVMTSIIERLVNFSPHADVHRLVADIRRALEGTTLAGAVSGITASNLSQPGFRNRLLSRIRNL